MFNRGTLEIHFEIWLTDFKCLSFGNSEVMQCCVFRLELQSACHTICLTVNLKPNPLIRCMMNNVWNRDMLIWIRIPKIQYRDLHKPLCTKETKLGCIYAVIF